MTLKRTIYRAGTLTVRAGYDDHGQLAIDGHDLGGHPASGEYEYFIRVRPEHFPQLRKAFGADESSDVVDLLVAHGAVLVESGETAWLTEHGIPYEFSNWF